MKLKQTLEELKPLHSGSNQQWGHQLISILASLICLSGAIYCLWTTRDVLVFLLLIGVATGQITFWQAIGQIGHHKHQGETAEGDGEERG